jgi:hypothetical protein
MSATSAHGDIKVYWLDNMLVVEPTSTFNIEGIIASIKTIKQLIDTRTTDKWARLIVFQNMTTLGPLGGLEPIIESFQYGALNGCQLISIVGGSAVNKENYTQISEHINLPIYFFDSFDEAQNFVHKNI